MVFGFGVGGQFFLFFCTFLLPIVKLLNAVLGMGACMQGGIR